VRHVNAATLFCCLALAGCGGGGAEQRRVSQAEGSWPPKVAPGTIKTVVGTGAYPRGGPGGGLGRPANKTELQLPIDLTFDDAGNLYIAERSNHRILKVDTSGIVTVAAGTVDENGKAHRGFSGDGGPATEAKLNSVEAIAAGPDGTLYIADAGNNRIRMVDEDGTITTVAGNGAAGFSGDGGPATGASLDFPRGLTVDRDGTFYFLDSHNFRIRKVDAGGTITTVAGTGTAITTGPGPGGTAITTVAGRGTVALSPDGTPATKAKFGFVGEEGAPGDHSPAGLALGRGGVLVFADLDNLRVWMIDARGLVRTVAGGGNDFPGDGGPATKGVVLGPLDVAIDAEGDIYISTHDHTVGGGPSRAPTGSNRVRMVTPKGIITTVAGSEKGGYSGDGGPATKARLNIPAGVAIGPDGNLYIADAENNRIRMVVLRR
jgi:trimeric autotransporter adhesin